MVSFAFISGAMHNSTKTKALEILIERLHLILRSLGTNRNVNIVQPQCTQWWLVKNISGGAVSNEVSFNNHPPKFEHAG